MMYRVFYTGGRPRLALPAEPHRLTVAAARRFQPGTIKRKAFRLMVDTSIRLRVEGMLSRNTSSPLATTAGFKEFPLGDWLEEVQRTLESQPLLAAIVWPPQVDRGRVYVHLLDDAGCAVAFAKISAQSHDRMLDAEAAALARLASMNLKRSRSPRLLASQMFADHRYILIEPLPESGRPVRMKWNALAPIVTEFAGDSRTLDVNALGEVEWWRSAARLRDDAPALHAALQSSAESSGIDVCRVHGDFGCHNLLRDGEDLWLYDWEHSSECGPKRTDEVNFWIGEHQRLILKSPEAGFKAFEARFLHDDQATREVAAALAYLHNGDISGATALAKQWRQSSAIR